MGKDSFPIGILFLICFKRSDYENERVTMKWGLNRDIKKRLVKALIWSVTLYGAETWKTSDEEKLSRCGYGEGWRGSVGQSSNKWGSTCIKRSGREKIFDQVCNPKKEVGGRQTSARSRNVHKTYKMDHFIQRCVDDIHLRPRQTTSLSLKDIIRPKQRN